MAGDGSQMTLTQFLERLLPYLDQHGDDIVCVGVTGCLSSNANVPVKCVGPGFDWDKGKILLFPDEPLCRWEKP